MCAYMGTHIDTHKTDIANSKLNLHFKRIKAVLSLISTMLCVWGEEHGLLTFIFSALSTMPCTQ